MPWSRTINLISSSVEEDLSAIQKSKSGSSSTLKEGAKDGQEQQLEFDEAMRLEEALFGEIPEETLQRRPLRQQGVPDESKGLNQQLPLPSPLHVAQQLLKQQYLASLLADGERDVNVLKGAETSCSKEGELFMGCLGSAAANYRVRNMGKKLDALFPRKFNTSKFSSLAKLAISRIAILKNRKQVRVSFAKSDVIQLLNLGYQERALLRVEHVIKDQGMADAFDMMEDYIHFLVDRVVQLQKNKECPDELKEAVSSLIFASSRCGEFPELQEIRGIFTSRFGKEFAAGAAELRSNCGVNSYIIENLSGRQPSLESRMKVLKDIASENGIILNLVEDDPVVTQENFHVDHQQQQQQQHHHHHHQQQHESKPVKLDVTEHQARTHVFPEEELSGSSRGRKYKDVASAALEAFESAVYAAQAARVAVELSRYESLENEQHGHGDSSHG
ncbi:hypothetical protein DKX38_027232 [Salix brachista]|uniref:Uncharacterized protein n=1 Tax=Salix brachista TaxID=2182728 RepID=A0A5N5JF52_9ROSI|nr:hypothetical protein DKX38_027232 [Salix brachista]